MNKFALALGTGALTLSLAITGCSSAPAGSSHGGHGSADDTESPSAAQANAADRMFATMMIPHHRQALEMSDIVLAKDGLDPAVVDLARKIKAAQQPEIDRMLDWLKSWGAEYDPDAAMDHGMSGMMSAEDLDALRTATGADAGRLFLEQMIAHHEGAVEMARTELDAGRSAEALALAQQVVDDQTEEIATMRRILEASE